MLRVSEDGENWEWTRVISLARFVDDGPGFDLVKKVDQMHPPKTELLTKKSNYDFFLKTIKFR